MKTPPLPSRNQCIIQAKSLLENRAPDQEPSIGSFFWNGKQGRLWLPAGPSCSCAQIRFPGREEAATFVKAASETRETDTERDREKILPQYQTV